MNLHSHEICASGRSRREFFQTAGAGAVSGAALLSGCAPGPVKGNVPTYAGIGVRPAINAAGTYTLWGGSLELPEVRAAMEAASQAYVNLDELMDAVGRRLAELTGAEWGIVTSGCAAALCMVTSACIAGSDPEKMVQLPVTAGMKNEVIAQKVHRFIYDHAVRQAGATIVTVETRDELLAAINERTCMFLVLGEREEDAEMSVKELAGISKQFHIPILVDAAAERPDIPNRYLADGADVVAYSGGKCLRGPQCSGLVLGRKDILQAAFLNSAPHHAVGRPMKVGKEEIMGLLAAVEAWIKTRDHKAEWAEWENRLAHIQAAVADIAGVQCEIQMPKRSNYTPILKVSWAEGAVRGAPREISELLLASDPRVYIRAEGEELLVNPYMMESGDHLVVAEQLRKTLLSRV